MKRTNQPRNTRGFTLIELLVVLTIVVGIIAAIVYKRSQANQTFQANEDTALTTNIYNAMQAQKVNPGYGVAAYNSYLLTKGVWDPRRFTTATAAGVTTVTAADGGTWTVTGNTTNFTATRTLYPFSSCTALLTNVDQNAYTSYTIAAATTNFPVNGAQATTSCGTSGTVTLILNSNG
jgi:prepilin-type N-terminal cleavage/methylation domain-containing protein